VVEAEARDLKEEHRRCQVGEVPKMEAEVSVPVAALVV